MSAANPSSLALTSIVDGSSMVASPVRNNFSDLQTAVNALVAVLALATAKGDLVVASASGVFDRVAVGANNKALVADSAQTPGVKWDYPPGYEYAYTEFTANVSVTATTEATANTVATASAVTFDGSTTVMVEFFSQNVIKGTTNMALWLYDGASSIGQIGAQVDQGSLRLSRRLTPAAAAKTYSVRASVDAGTGSVAAGAGGVGVSVPGYIRITKV